MDQNPWLEVALADYEAHMALPHVAQAQLLSDVFAGLIDRYSPRSVAVVGCAGGNGFERIDPAIVQRVVGIDINRAFVDAAAKRYENVFQSLELVCADLEHDPIDIEPVDLVYAALLLEYVDLARGFDRLRALSRRLIAVVSQLQSATIPEITPSPYASLSILGPSFHFVDTTGLTRIAAESGWLERESRVLRSAGGKEFRLQVFGAGR